mmetsp:Transcript_51442/g.147504  ORF Transcript_51442/g.147504 Transcript_51442/m.147504 type:complete len:221 (+) Transcript_51442:46-708(+)
MSAPPRLRHCRATSPQGAAPGRRGGLAGGRAQRALTAHGCVLGRDIAGAELEVAPVGSTFEHHAVVAGCRLDDLVHLRVESDPLHGLLGWDRMQALGTSSRHPGPPGPPRERREPGLRLRRSARGAGLRPLQPLVQLALANIASLAAGFILLLLCRGAAADRRSAPWQHHPRHVPRARGPRPARCTIGGPERCHPPRGFARAQQQTHAHVAGPLLGALRL